MLTDQLHIWFGEMSIQVLSQKLGYLFIVDFKSSLFILDTRPLSDI